MWTRRRLVWNSSHHSYREDPVGVDQQSISLSASQLDADQRSMFFTLNLSICLRLVFDEALNLIQQCFVIGFEASI